MPSLAGDCFTNTHKVHTTCKYQLPTSMKYTHFLRKIEFFSTKTEMQRNFPWTANEITLLSVTNQKSKLIVITQMYRSIMDGKYPVIKKCLLAFVSLAPLFFALPQSVADIICRAVREIAFTHQQFYDVNYSESCLTNENKIPTLYFVFFFFSIILHGLRCIYLFIFILSPIVVVFSLCYNFPAGGCAANAYKTQPNVCQVSHFNN